MVRSGSTVGRDPLINVRRLLLEVPLIRYRDSHLCYEEQQ